LQDYAGKNLSPLESDGANLVLGKLPVGFYRLLHTDGKWVSIGVLARLQSPTPRNSPIGVDVAMSWFYTTNRMPEVANLCSLAGMNWVRDRLTWSEMEPERGKFSGGNRYDEAARIQSDAGLRVLQVIHSSPAWANPETKRFPLDLRDAHRFFAEMARRWRGHVQAFEPWNEADIPMFGGHTGSEMAALQKAAFLGLRAGNRDLIACFNVFALPNEAQLADLHQNDAWDYWDTFNLHHYQPFEKYPQIYQSYRNVAAGRPLWVTECALPVRWAGDEKLKEPTDSDLRVQAERVAKTFACSLHEGSEATYYFLLPHYVEGQTQFGVLRPDLTPRPAFVALAAAGRLLAGAKPLGRWQHTNTAVQAYLFAAESDGKEREVLVAWTTGPEVEMHLPAGAERQFDHLGREVASERTMLSAEPVFVVFEKGARKSFTVAAPPARGKRLAGEVCPVVLQTIWPAKDTSLDKSAYRVQMGTPVTIPVYAYNFGKGTARGTLRVTSSTEFSVTCPAQTEVKPGGRLEIPVQIGGIQSTGKVDTIRLEGDFGRSGKSVLSFRVTGQSAR
jgi:hypothetical protein